MLIRSFDSKLLLADGGSPIGRKLFSAKPGEEMKVSSNAKQTLSEMDMERAPTTAELNEPKVGERNRESDALVPNCCSAFLCFADIFFYYRAVGWFAVRK